MVIVKFPIQILWISPDFFWINETPVIRSIERPTIWFADTGTLHEKERAYIVQNMGLRLDYIHAVPEIDYKQRKVEL